MNEGRAEPGIQLALPSHAQCQLCPSNGTSQVTAQRKMTNMQKLRKGRGPAWGQGPVSGVTGLFVSQGWIHSSSLGVLTPSQNSSQQEPEVWRKDPKVCGESLWLFKTHSEVFPGSFHERGRQLAVLPELRTRS